MRGFIAFPKSVPEGAKFRNTPQLAAGIGILRIMEVYLKKFHPKKRILVDIQ